MLRKLIVFALILCVALPTLAQVELRVDVDVSSDFKELTDDNKTVVDFLYLTQKDEFCTTFLIDDTQYEPSVCVFEDIITDELHLYAFGSITTYFIVFYEGQAVALLARDMGVSNLRPGNYEILVLRGWSTKTPRALVSFTISDDSDVVVSDVVESIELETPELGTTWQRSEKHEMKSGCNVSYALIDFDPPAIVVVLKEEKTIQHSEAVI